MSLECELTCPRCDGTTFYRAASTEINLGEKVKWRCGAEDCEYTLVTIGEDVDTTSVWAGQTSCSTVASTSPRTTSTGREASIRTKRSGAAATNCS